MVLYYLHVDPADNAGLYNSTDWNYPDLANYTNELPIFEYNSPRKKSRFDTNCFGSFSTDDISGGNTFAQSLDLYPAENSLFDFSFKQFPSPFSSPIKCNNNNRPTNHANRFFQTLTDTDNGMEIIHEPLQSMKKV